MQSMDQDGIRTHDPKKRMDVLKAWKNGLWTLWIYIYIHTKHINYNSVMRYVICMVEYAASQTLVTHKILHYH